MPKKTPKRSRSGSYQPAAKKAKTPDKKTMLIWGSVAVLAVAALAFFLLRPDGTLPVKKLAEGFQITVPAGEQWLTINKGTKAKPRYYKLATMTGLDGFKRDESFYINSDRNVGQYRYEPFEKKEGDISYFVMGVSKPAEQIAREAREGQGAMAKEARVSEPMTVKVGGRDCPAFIATVAVAKENGALSHTKTMALYLPARHEGSVLINLTAAVPGFDQGPADEAYVALAQQVAQTITVVP